VGQGKGYVIIDNNGIGIKVFVPTPVISKMPSKGGMVKLFTYFHVREDIMSLYGFLTEDELSIFELLTQVSGVGPKAGLAALSTLPPSKLGLAILESDTKALTTIPGIGNKTAHRIILELKDKINKDDIIGDDMGIQMTNGDVIQEAIGGLVSLGYTEGEARGAVMKLKTEGMNTEDLIKQALKNLIK
jgi:Holliday junction DNA helicase RuvA